LPSLIRMASSFTLIKGSMVDETYAVFAAWDFARSKRENLNRLRDKNFIGASSATWLRDVAKVLSLHFNPEVEGDVRERALGAIKLFHQIVGEQFGVFGPWHIPDAAGLILVRKDAEQRWVDRHRSQRLSR
jgi:hypothetical protein